MKKLFTLLFALSVTFGVSAQNFTFSPASQEVYKYGSASNFELVGYATFYNQQASSNITWKRVSVSPGTPSQWSNAICDKISCWDVGVGRNEIVVPQGDSSILDLHLYPANTGGSTTVAIAVWADNDSANADTILYHFNVWPVSVNNVKKEEKLLVYPNPARTTLTLSFETSETVRVEIFDVLGRLMKTTTHSSKTSVINVEDLPVGLYVIRVYDKANTYSKTFKKVQ